ncbi:MAG: hypothetical protein HY323_05420 [Betaproteobacteria bacterium]|nr:hypothetical protein [Betaproteobacteria bacterium]
MSEEAERKLAPREAIARALANEIDVDSAVALLQDSLQAEKEYWASCPRCNKRIQVKGPDIMARVKGLEALVKMGLGKAREAPAPLPVGATLGEMSDEELAALVAAG